MKPVNIRFRCFGPYMAEQYIDFSQLEQNGLFLICGSWLHPQIEELVVEAFAGALLIY